MTVVNKIMLVCSKVVITIMNIIITILISDDAIIAAALNVAAAKRRYMNVRMLMYSASNVLYSLMLI